MDPKVIEMNNLRVLNDYLNQTLDVLARGPRLANGHTPGLGYSPFAGTIPTAAAPVGTDIVYGPGFYGFGGAPLFGALSQPFAAQPFAAQPFAAQPFAATSPFAAMPAISAGYNGYSPYSWQQPWQQTPWTAGQPSWAQPSWPVEAARQAQFTQALAAKQSVLEAMCKVAGILPPV